MNRYKIIFLLSILVFTSSCEDYLDKSPLNVVSDNDVWMDPNAIDAYMVNLYENMQVEDFNYEVIAQAGFLSTVTDIAVRSYGWGGQNDPIVPSNAYGWWGYGSVRKVNVFLEQIESANVDENLKQRYLAEGHFIRAFYYFSMVKRYGGVPIITEPQEFTGDNISELQVPRATEKEVYDFVRSELNLAIDGLPESYGATEKYRASKYTALALMSRAMLYAGSIAKYSDVQLNGLVGISKQEAATYFQYSMEASEELMNAGFSLYNQSGNKAENFQNLFLNADNNSEIIFAKVFSSPDKTHSYDFFNAPQSFRVDYGNAINPSLSLVEDYEYIDGRSGELKVKDASGNPIHYDNPYELFEGKDPRFFATILAPFSPWQGGVLEIRAGILDKGQYITSSNLTDTYGSGSEAVTIVGKDGPLTTWDPTKTGFYVKKSMNPTERVNYGRSEQPWIVFRLGEILLNHAEAALELGQSEKALASINQIRERAGIIALNSVDIDKVRHERKVELAFENHRFWDIRRWRTATSLLNNTQFKALYPWLNWGTKDYTFTIVDAPKNTRTFLEKTYYEPIPYGEIEKNPNLIQNPGY
ncbi:RagB/SusD family nutrient uptake outer membrane protein [Gelidibacter salicanalis]|uniref:RagB/SusD family nutrient uptake outer membrane protein n=1 Tax=Gelidibacter salicanalis TaxID=291193 RepID=A0A5C7AK53_9FLAO|nr:RagB/SusD family nutrient uptake outer membrane protein [Gelidibacter salicanalis]TXE09150.1 RagB/SusD family nutrient uptake outer membrane protein [Gelidibacter salicanalis]